MTKEKALEIGIKEFALKPFTKNTIGLLVRRALDSKS